jgi:outer membrane protein OmpA-like peptidoglycan-associated protein
MAAPTPPAPTAPIMGNIATAQSGAVPFSAIKSPPGGPIQVAVIQFGRMSSGLGGNDYAVLAKVAQIQRTNGATVRVVAHSDQDATASSVEALARGNFEVSRRRALAVANQLVQLGVPVDRIVAEAASDGEPVYQTNTARGVAANRRAEIFVDF